MWKLDKIILILIAITLAWLFVTYFGNIFVWLILSLFVCIIGLPIVNFFEKIRIKKLYVPKWLASLLTVLIISGIAFLFLFFLVPLLSNEIGKFQAIDTETISEKFNQPIKQLEDWLISYGFVSRDTFSIDDFVTKEIHNIVSFKILSSFINNIGGIVLQLLIGVFSIIFISFFFLKDKDSIVQKSISIVSEKIQQQIRKIIDEVKTLLIRFFYGTLLEMLFMFIFCTIGFLIIGINFNLSLLIAILIAFLNIIPYIGPIIATVIGMILLTLGNFDLDFSTELGVLQLKFLAIIVISQIIDRLFLSTYIYSKSVKAHPVEIYLVIIVAGSLYGIVGMIFAIPVYTIVRVIAKTVIGNNRKVVS